MVRKPAVLSLALALVAMVAGCIAPGTRVTIVGERDGPSQVQTTPATVADAATTRQGAPARSLVVRRGRETVSDARGDPYSQRWCEGWSGRPVDAHDLINVSLES